MECFQTMRNETCRGLKSLTSALALIAVMVLVGCDNNSSSAPTTVVPDSATTQTRSATTVLRVKLDPVPFTVEIPPDWYVGPNALDTDMVLRGPTSKDDPKGYAARQGTLDTQEEISNEHFTALIDKFKRDAGANENTEVKIYEIGPITAVEINVHRLDNTTQPIEKPEMLVQQTFYLFGPGSEGKHTSSVIRFGFCTVAEFEADRSALTKIIKSLELPVTETETLDLDANTTKPALP